MSERRRMLLAIVNQFKWLPYSYTYLYHSLVPQTISGKNVRNKAKFTKIYGNSEVVNQLVPDTQIFGNSANVSVSFNSTTHEYTFTTSTNDWRNPDYNENVVNSISGHKYLLVLNITSKSANANIRLRFPLVATETSIIEPTTDLTRFNVQIMSTDGNSATATFIVNYIDLTKQYPFDTPTTLTDNRVKNILAQGYIPYNLGEIKDMVIGEIGSDGYNLFDEIVSTNHYWDNTGTLISTPNFDACENPIRILGGRTYMFSKGANSTYSSNTFYYRFLDENKKPITTTDNYVNANNNLVAPNNAIYLVFYSNFQQHFGSTPEIALHLVGTRTGYAPHTQPQTISFKYQGSGVGTSHDTMEIGKENVVFTKDRALVDLGSLTFTYNQQYSIFETPALSNMKVPLGSEIVNGICPVAKPIASNNRATETGKRFYIYDVSSTLTFRDMGYTSVSDFTNAMNGVPLEYQLATPQTITIPRKHLAVVDLGSLNWVYVSSGNYFYVGLNASKGALWNDIANIYCAKYLSIAVSSLRGGTKGIAIYKVNDNYKQLEVCDNSYTNATDFKNAMQGVYLFYETDVEVPDITDTFDIEAGGSVNGNLFSWVENQLLANNNFASVSGWIASNCSYTVSGNVATIVPSAIHSAFQQYLGTTLLANGHKYLVVCDIKYGSGESYTLNVGNITETRTGTGGWEYIRKIVAPTNTNGYFNIFDYDSNIRSTWYLKNVDLIDLTLGFGAGNEPTDINDYRIKYILEHWYIPTNTTGIQTSVDTQVLPNVDMSFKCK